MIKHCISSKTCNGFYREYIFNIEDQYNNERDTINNITFNNAPTEIIVIGKPFYNNNKEREIMITMHDANTLHEYITKKNKQEEEKVSLNNIHHLIDRNNNKVSEYINSIVQSNSYFKNFFANTDMMGFGRIHINTNEILMCNDYFENLFKYNDDKERYLNILLEIINDYDVKDYGGFYIHNINFKNKDMRMIFTYDKDVIDIVIMEKESRRNFANNNSMEFMCRLYNHSDLPIIIVDKKANILCKNNVFISMFKKETNDATKKKKSSKAKQINDNLLKK